jgi:outer membrane protein assembly factor BamE (lipoprotein component of BamABCDE complex)
MNYRRSICAAAMMLAGVAATGAYGGNLLSFEQKLAQVTPGVSTKAQVQSLLGTPWRVVQFNDCGEALGHQSDETWDYRGKDASGSYRAHIEFDEHDVAHLVAKIPDNTSGDKGTSARIAPAGSQVGAQMAGMRM